MGKTKKVKGYRVSQENIAAVADLASTWQITPSEVVRLFMPSRQMADLLIELQKKQSFRSPVDFISDAIDYRVRTHIYEDPIYPIRQQLRHVPRNSIAIVVFYLKYLRARNGDPRYQFKEKRPEAKDRSEEYVLMEDGSPI